MIEIKRKSPGFYVLLIDEHFTKVSEDLTSEEVKILANQIKELGF